MMKEYHRDSPVAIYEDIGKSPEIGDADRECLRYYIRKAFNIDEDANLGHRRRNYLKLQDDYTKEWDEKHGYPHSHRTGEE